MINKHLLTLIHMHNYRTESKGANLETLRSRQHFRHARSYTNTDTATWHDQHAVLPIILVHRPQLT